jgi:tetratricopeptide (TPR) repeat protein
VECRCRFYAGEKTVAANVRNSTHSVTFTATRLSVNQPLPQDAFAFHFPDKAVVRQESANSKTTKIMVWGPDNTPVKEFATEADLANYESWLSLEKTRKAVESKLSSKAPADLLERGEYYGETKVFDKSLAAFSAVIAADPKSEKAAEALCGRGNIYLLGKKDFAAAEKDFSEFLRLHEVKSAEERSRDDVSMLYFMRGLAYANQENRLNEALADMKHFVAELQEEKNNVENGADIQFNARLICAAIYLKQVRIDQALAEVVQAIKTDPKLAGNFAVRCLFDAIHGTKDKAESERKLFTVDSPAGEEAYDWMDVNFNAIMHTALLHILPDLERFEAI